MLMEAEIPEVADSKPAPKAVHREGSTGPADTKTVNGASTIKSPDTKTLTSIFPVTVGEMVDEYSPSEHEL